MIAVQIFFDFECDPCQIEAWLFLMQETVDEPTHTLRSSGRERLGVQKVAAGIYRTVPAAVTACAKYVTRRRLVAMHRKLRRLRLSGGSGELPDVAPLFEEARRALYGAIYPGGRLVRLAQDWRGAPRHVSGQ